MKWWQCIITLICIMTPFYIFFRRQDIRGAIGCLRVYFAVIRQPRHICGFTFISDGEKIFLDYLVINSAGVFAVSLHNIRGKNLRHYHGRMYLKTETFYKVRMYFNPVPHDVRKVIKLNALVSADTDIIPVVVFPRGNDKKVRAMWVTPLNKLGEVFAETGDKPLSDEQVEQVYSRLKRAKVRGGHKAKRKYNGFIKRRCPECGEFIYDRNENSTFYIKCDNCGFRRDFTASIIPDENS